MAYESSSAYEYERFEKQEKTEIKKVQSGGKGKKQGSVFKAVFCMLLITVMLSALIYTRVVQTELNAQYNASVKTLNTLKGENARLEIQLNETLSKANIEELARNQLGMQEISNGQREYMYFDSSDKAEVLKEPSAFDSFFAWIGGLFG